MNAGVSLSGSSQNPALVLLHSSMSSSKQWQGLVKQLCTDYFVINIDLLGYGKAPAVSDPQSFSMASECQRILAIIDELGIEQFGLIAHSYGAANALKLAYELPARVTQFCVFEPVAFHLLPADNPGRKEVEAISAVMHGDDHALAAKTFVDYWNGEGFYQSVPLSMQQQFNQQVNKVRLDFQALTGEGYSLSDYQALSQPGLLLTGKNSRQSSLAVAQGLSEVVEGLQVKAVDGGHMAPISHSQQVNEQIITFIASQ